MKIEIIVDKVKEGREVFLEGDIRTVPDEMGRRMVGAGWARDLAGEVETGSTDGGPLEVQNLNITSKTEAK